MNTDFKLSVEFGVDISDVEKQLKKVQKAFEKATKNINKTIDKTTDDISDQFEDMVDDIEDGFNDIEDGFKDASKKIVKTTDDTTKKVTKKFDDMVDDATDDFDDLDSKFSKATNNLKGTADKTVNAISNSFNSISNLSIGSGMESSFSRATSGMVSTSDSITSRIRANFSNITSGISTQFSRISSSLKTATGDMPNIASNIVAGVNGKMRRIAGKAKEDFTKIEGYFDTGTDEIISTAKKVTSRTSQEFTKLSGKSKNEFNSIGGSFKKAFNQVQNESKDAVNKMEQHFGKIPNAVVTHWGKTTTVLSGHISKWEKFWHKFVAKVMNGAIGIKNGIVSAFKTISSKVGSVLATLGGYVSSAFNKIESKADNTADEMADDFEDSGNKIEGVFDGIKGKITGIATAIAGAFGVSAISGFIDETRELNKELGKVMFSLSQKGLSSSDTSEAYSKVFAVIGDEGRTGETLQNLGSVSSSKKQLEDLSELVTDVHLTLGERVTPEALAESIALTTQLGEIDGNLSDALAHCGISTDDFNDKLANCTSQQQRLAMITTALSGTFAGATDAYAKANPEIYALNEALGKNQLSFMNLGNVLSPLKTKFLNDFLTPLYDWLAKKLPSAINSVLGWFDTLKGKLTAVDWGAWLEDLRELGGYIGGTVSGIFETLGEKTVEIAEGFGLLGDDKKPGKAMEALKGFFKWTEEHSEGIANAIMIIGSALAGAKIASAISGIAGAIEGLTIAMATNPVGLLAMGIGALVGVILIYGEDILKFLEKIGGKIGETFDGWYDKYFKGALEACGRFFRGETEWQQNLSKSWDELWSGLASEKNIDKMKGFLNGIIKYLNNGISKFLTGINYIIKGINWVYKKVTGSEENKFSEINTDKWKVPELAKGTSNWRGGTALVGEAGRELVSDSKLGTFVANSPMLLPLSKGASVLRNSKTEKILNGAGIPAFANGTNEGLFDGILDSIGTIWDYLTDPSKLWKKVIDKIDLNFGGNTIISGLASGVKEIFNGSFVIDWIKNLFKDNESKNPANALPTSNPKLVGAIGKYITSPYGFRNIFGKGEFHGGVDLAGGIFGNGMPVFSQSAGKVLTSGYSKSAGYWNVIESAGRIFKYMHMQKGSLTKKVGDMVKAGEMIGKIGSTGRSTGAHLHFQVEANGKKINPMPFFTGAGYKFANGGVVDKPTFGVFGEAGTEAIVPLTAGKVKPFGESVVNSLLEMVGGNGASNDETHVIHTHIYLDKREIGVAVSPIVREENERYDKRINRLNGRK